MWTCKHCGKEFFDLSPSEKANHTRWCDRNPNRKKYSERLKKTRENISLDSRNKANEKIKKAWKEGKYKNINHGDFWKGRTHSEGSKKKMSKSRKKFLNDNPDKHPWKRSEKFKSIPCEYLKEKLKDNGFEFQEEYMPLYPNRYFSVDIAFPEQKIGIEVNGNQHYYRNGSLKKYYMERHKIIENQGWILIELHYSKVFCDTTIQEIILKLKK